jgi:hypothetical protein
MTIAAETPNLAPARTGSKTLNVALWGTQLVLAAMFGMAGFMKTTAPMDVLAQKLVWPGALPEGLVRFIGTAEFLAAVGLILPAVTRIRPMLTPLAATGLVVVMALAVPFHLSRGELQALAVNIPLGALAAFVAWGRLKKAPILPRR